MLANLSRTKMKLHELIQNSNVLLAIVIGIITVFLIICLICFYNAFYEDGIPQHLKEDKKSESPEDEMEEEMLMEGEGMGGMADMEKMDNGNGTQ